MSTWVSSGADPKADAIERWHELFRDEAALLACPSRHHKALLTQAHTLFRAHIIDCADLSDLLEQADGALAYAVETLIDRDADGYEG